MKSYKTFAIFDTYIIIKTSILLLLVLVTKNYIISQNKKKTV